MKLLLCIDDTDMLGGKGTGKLMEELCQYLSSQIPMEYGFVSRHQLYVHKDIPYTSHNSAMCREVILAQEDVEAMLALARAFLERECAPGSDPGLCVIAREKLTEDEKSRLIDFGWSAKRTVLLKQDAYDLAAGMDCVFLSEHGGTGQGVIGAISGCGLRLGGGDGRVKGKIEPEDPDEITSVGELCDRYGFARAMADGGEPAADTDTVLYGSVMKAVCRNDERTIILLPDETGRAVWRPIRKEEWKKY